MEARLLNNFQSIECKLSGVEDEKSTSILSLKERLTREVQEYNVKEINLKQKISLIDAKITEVKKLQLECEDFSLLDEDEEDLISNLKTIDISKSVILYDEKLADKCELSPEESKSWAVRSHAYYGSFLNPMSYARSFSVWSGADKIIRQTPLIGEYIAGPSTVTPESVMLKLKQILIDSTRRKVVNQDLFNAIQEKEKLERELKNCRAFCQANQLEIERIELVHNRIVNYDLIMSLTTKVSHEPFKYLEALLDAKNTVNAIKCTQHQGFELFIKDRVDKLDAEINGVIKVIINEYDNISNPEYRYDKLKKSRRALYNLGVKVPDELYVKIQQLRLQKAWDTTYEIHKFGDIKREFKHYFLGVPQDLGHKGHFAFAWFLYTVGCGFLFTPIKNILKLFTEALPKSADAYCQNKFDKIDSSDFFLAGHYFFKTWWLCLRPITSPIVSIKAAWNSYDKIENKYSAWTARLVLSGLSFALSFAVILAVIVVVPKVVLGLLGEAGGVVASAAVAADSAILPAVPVVTYASAATAIRGAVDVGLERSSSAKVAARISLNKNAVSAVPPKGVDVDNNMPSHYIKLPESKPSERPSNFNRKL